MRFASIAVLCALWTSLAAATGGGDGFGSALSERLGQPIPLEARFWDQGGRPVRLGDLLDGQRPLVLVPGYYHCPMLCSLVHDGMARAVRDLGWTPGERFAIASFSFDAEDGAADASARQRAVLPVAGGLTPERWPFLVGTQGDIDRVLEAIGLRVARDGGQFAHPAFAIVVAPDGRISRYLYGIEFAARDLRLSLVEAAQGRIGTLADRVLLYCYHWDPAAHRYGWAVVGLMRLGGLLTLAAMALGWWLLIRRRRASVAA
jgi:protein SCO1/2